MSPDIYNSMLENCKVVIYSILNVGLAMHDKITKYKITNGLTYSPTSTKYPITPNKAKI